MTHYTHSSITKRFSLFLFVTLLLSPLHFASAGFYSYGQFGSLGSGNGQFNSPFGIAISTSTGDIYVGDSSYNRIQKFDSSGMYQSQFGSYGSGNGEFNGVTGIAFDAAGNIYVVDANNNRIQKFDSSGVYQSQFGSPGSGNGQLDYPTSLAFDASGNIYVTDAHNHRIQKFDSSGVYQSQFGSPGSGNQQFNNPIMIALDASGTIYVSDINNNRVQRIKDGPATSVSNLSLTESRSGTFTIVLDSAPSEDVTINFSASTPDAGAGASVSPASITFTASSWDTPQTVTVTATDDSVLSPDRTVTISGTLSSSDPAFNNAPGPRIYVTIADNDIGHITSCAELQAINNFPTGRFVLDNDIDCQGFDPEGNGKGFMPIGTSTPFSGSFNGQGHTISNLTISRPDENNVGLFGYTDSGTFENVTISGTISGYSYVGALGGNMNGNPIVDHVTSSAAVNAISYYVGGLIGWSSNISLSDSHMTGPVSRSGIGSATYIGGLVGFISGYGGTITRSTVSGDITVSSEDSSTWDIGGLVGSSSGTSIVDSSFSGHLTATASGSSVGDIGGLAGYADSYSETISGSSVTGNITVNSSAQAYYIGGFIGGNNSSLTIDDSHMSGDLFVTASSSVYQIGGMTGYGTDGYVPFTVTDSSVSGNLTIHCDSDVSYIGGMTGYLYSGGAFTNASTSGSISLTSGSYQDYIGGFVGYNDDNSVTIKDSTMAGDLIIGSGSTAQDTGGFFGYSYGAGIIDNSHSSGNISITASGLVQYVSNMAGYSDYYGPITITDSSTTGNLIITSNDWVSTVGGLSAYAAYAGSIDNSYATGRLSITAEGFVQSIGGLVGYSSDGYSFPITGSYSTGDISVSTTGSATDIGGLVGNYYFAGTMERVYSTGTLTVHAVNGAYDVGGLVGYNVDDFLLTNAYANRDISVTSESADVDGVASVLGFSDASITMFKTYAAGSVTVSSGVLAHNIGGLIGYDWDLKNLSDSFAATTISASTSVSTSTIGAVIGRKYFDEGILSGVYYDVPTSTLSVCVGNEEIDPTGCTGVSTASYFKNNSINAPLSSWDFTSVWQTTDTYPTLRFAATSTPETSVTPTPTPTTRRSSGGGSSFVVNRTAVCGQGEHVSPNGLYCISDALVGTGCTAEARFSTTTGLPCTTTTTLTGTTTPTSYTFTIDRKMKDVGDDILVLQKYLNSHNFIVARSGPGSAGNETTRFGPATFAAVKKLQTYAKLPPTGFFGPRTRAYVNAHP